MYDNNVITEKNGKFQIMKAMRLHIFGIGCGENDTLLHQTLIRII